MNKIKHIIISLTILIIATALIISATYIGNIDRGTRAFIGLVYMTTLTVTLILTYIRICKMDNK